ncbi:ABC-type transport auxiliary lipoprotein family protein [Noviherbaspirillum aerium]|uniref:ABC-type transport auxiliary lipoprotein family protein n=1 Tax=Noviherbaspirillum aerium TaxID=2588497 RepID=UPI00124C53D1|nr:ABC-type transport auxiliary lipoprotein family protein [Noviherbaspirillum aerium]
MKTHHALGRRVLIGAGIAALSLLSACSVVSRPDAAMLYDLGPLRTQAAAPPQASPTSQRLPALPALSIADIQVPAWLDSSLIFYRLSYANEQQPRPYAQARWSMPPGQLLQQHLKSRIAQAGGAVLSPAAAAPNVPVLRIEADDFTQIFSSPAQSVGQVSLRASVFRERTLVAQRSFVRQAPAPSADAAGGVRALADAGDAALGAMIAWLASLDLK